MKKILTAILAILVLTLAMVGCGAPAGSAVTPVVADATTPAGHSVEAIKALGVIKITTESQYAPFAFKNKEGKIVGLEPTIMEYIAKDLGVKLEIMDVEFTAVIPNVQSGIADIGMAGLTPTAERKKSVDVSALYNKGGQCLVVMAKDVDKYADKAALKGVVIGAQKGSLQQELGETQFEGFELKLLPKVPQLVLELQSGGIGALLMDETSAKMYTKSYPDIAVSKIAVDVVEEEAGSAAVVMLGNESLKTYLNELFAKLETDGTLAKYYTEAKELADSMAE